MKVHILGHRTVNPVFFDMACRFRPSGGTWYGLGFRIGDRAGAVAYLGDWRERNPHRKLIVLEDNFIPHCGYSKRLEARWMFQGIADEVRSATIAHEIFRRPASENLYRETLWKSWFRIMHGKRIFTPHILPDVEAATAVTNLTSKLGIPKRFVTIQPLWDAAYDVHRNRGPAWWEQLIRILSPIVPLVVIGDVKNSSKVTVPEASFPAWNYGLDAMSSLEFIRRAAWHVGGETGLTLWAPMVKTPTVAVYSEWVRRPGKLDTRPMTFGLPVVHAPLGEMPDVVANLIIKAYTEPQIESTPV